MSRSQLPNRICGTTELFFDGLRKHDAGKPCVFLNPRPSHGAIARTLFSVPEKYRASIFNNKNNDLNTIFSTEADTEQDSDNNF